MVKLPLMYKALIDHRCDKEVKQVSAEKDELIKGCARDLEKCKLSTLCAMQHVLDEPYARCVGKPLKS